MAGDGVGSTGGAADAPEEVYRRNLREGRLTFQRCGGCGRAVFYPRVLCPFCGGEDLGWEESSGRGEVYATTAIYRRDSEPRNVCLVDLAEGFRMMSRIEGIPAEEVRIGAPVRLRIDETEDGPLPLFVPDEAGGGR